MSALSLKALAAAQAALAAGVHGGQPARFRGPEVDVYLANVGLDAEHDGANGPGYPWCSAFVYSMFKAALAEFGGDLNPCPRTASALHLWNNAPDSARLEGLEASLPAPGDVFVLVHHDGIHGHTGFVESVSPDGRTITTVEGDTDTSGSSTGDAVGRHENWTPSDGTRGRLLGFLDFG